MKTWIINKVFGPVAEMLISASGFLMALPSELASLS